MPQGRRAPEKMNKVLYVFLSLLLTGNIAQAQYTHEEDGLMVSETDITVFLRSNETVNVYQRTRLEDPVNVTLIAQHPELVNLSPVNFIIDASHPNQSIQIQGVSPGRLQISSKSTPDEPWITKNVFFRITVAHSEPLIYVSIVVGWIYFVAWSISFYPQMYINYKRKSVVGLNFDFLALNIAGFTLYASFNIGLLWIPEIRDEYFLRNPRGLNPVLLNDVVFSLHAIFATSIVIIQCFIYESADQRVSRIAMGILAVYGLIIIASAGLVLGNVIVWLDFLYYCSYIKLSASIIKYVPQAIMNYRRKSTIGWSIENILLDFTGGVLSMLQMIINAYNYDDWVSIFGDPTKFGLGLFSVLFDIFFMLQHYVFYSSKRTTRCPKCLKKRFKIFAAQRKVRKSMDPKHQGSTLRYAKIV